MRILIVEDEYFIASNLIAVLEKHGHQVTAVPSANAAVDAVAQNPPDLAILDVDLGNGQPDGVSVAERLRPLSVPVIFFSGETLEEGTVRSLALGHVDKAFGPGAMANVVKWVEARARGGSSRAPQFVRYCTLS